VKVIAPALIQKQFDVTKQTEIDQFLLDLDGTQNKGEMQWVILGI
jgi:enolase